MSRIDGLSSGSPVQPFANSSISRTVQTSDANSRPVDRLELSGLSHMLKVLSDGDVRADKVASVRAQIESGTYEDDQKLDAAIDRMIEDLDL